MPSDPSSAAPNPAPPPVTHAAVEKPLPNFTHRPRSPTRCRNSVKRKVAMLVAYDGSCYHGLQRNRDVLTVSDTLEAALHAAGAIADSNVGALDKIQWQVAARTDRGVSAAGNLVSAKLLFPRADLDLERGLVYAAQAARINDHLPANVRVLAVRHVTGSFSARSSCDARWYEYLLPASALGEVDNTLGSAADTRAATFDELLQAYVGSNFFHNFTVGTDHTIPPRDQARRVITHISAEWTDAILAQDRKERWIRVRVQGQSFMLHQIRKMISLAVLTHRGETPKDAIQRALRPDVLVNIPPAPALGLFLDAVHFGWYNERHADVLTEALTLASVDGDREKFKREHILPIVARQFETGDDLDIFFETAKTHPVRFE